jgi:hypothetical protein
VNKVLYVLVPQNAGYFLSGWATNGFTRRTRSHEVRANKIYLLSVHFRGDPIKSSSFNMFPVYSVHALVSKHCTANV